MGDPSGVGRKEPARAGVSLSMPDDAEARMMSFMRPIADANASLPGPEREVLALLVESGLGYEEIGGLLGVDAAAVAAIAARARLRLARGSVPRLDAACTAELPLLAARIDGAAPGSSAHGEECAVCRANLDAMRAVDAEYRAWCSAPMPEALRERTRAALRPPR